MLRLRKSGALRTVNISSDRCRWLVKLAIDKIQTSKQALSLINAFGALDHSSGLIEVVSPEISFKIGRCDSDTRRECAG